MRDLPQKRWIARGRRCFVRVFPQGVVAYATWSSGQWHVYAYRGNFPLGVEGATRPRTFATVALAKAAATRMALKEVRGDR